MEGGLGDLIYNLMEIYDWRGDIPFSINNKFPTIGEEIFELKKDNDILFLNIKEPVE